MTLSGRRIAAGAVLILVLAASAIAYKVRLASSVVATMRDDTPTALDLSSEEARRAFRYLRDSDANQLTSPWLADTCSAHGQFPGEVYVLARDDRLNQALWFQAYERGVEPIMEARGYVIRMYGSGGSVTRSRSKTARQAFGVAQAALSPGDVDALRVAIRDSGFFQMPIGGLFGACHAEITSFESCVDGRYHAAVRMCHDDSAVLLALADTIEQRLAKLDGWQPVAHIR